MSLFFFHSSLRSLSIDIFITNWYLFRGGNNSLAWLYSISIHLSGLFVKNAIFCHVLRDSCIIYVWHTFNSHTHLDQIINSKIVEISLWDWGDILVLNLSEFCDASWLLWYFESGYSRNSSLIYAAVISILSFLNSWVMSKEILRMRYLLGSISYQNSGNITKNFTVIWQKISFCTKTFVEHQNFFFFSNRCQHVFSSLF